MYLCISVRMYTCLLLYTKFIHIYLINSYLGSPPKKSKVCQLLFMGDAWTKMLICQGAARNHVGAFPRLSKVHGTFLVLPLGYGSVSTASRWHHNSPRSPPIAARVAASPGHGRIQNTPVDIILYTCNNVGSNCSHKLWETFLMETLRKQTHQLRTCSMLNL